MSEERDELLARKLAAALNGEASAEPDEEAQAMAEFARALPWPQATPDPHFRARLRGEVAARRPGGRHWRRLNVRWVAVPAFLVLLAVGGLLLAGPRLQRIFGPTYNLLPPERRAAAVYTMPPAVPTAPPAVSPLGLVFDADAWSVYQFSGAYLEYPAVVRVTAVPALSTPLPGAAASPAPVPPAVEPQRMVIKNGQLLLTVQDTDVAVGRLTGIAAQYGGYILSSQTWYNGPYKEATIVLSVPAVSFEQALNRAREIALRVEQESAAGQDVTDQYVDLESQLRNLEATAERLRTFLDKATTVDEALKVNNQLAQIEGQIEQVKGKMNYLAAKAAFSTITVEVRPERPTPTPTATPTATPTPTPTPSPTPAVWQPGKTAGQAGNVLTSVLRFLGEAAIWLAVVVVPLVGVPLGVVALVVWVARRSQRKGSRSGG